MPPPFKRHVFICTNERSPGHPKGDCVSKGSPEVVKAFKAELVRRGLKSEIRAQRAGCLDNCALGVSVVVYPEAVWYAHVTVDDVPEIVEKHLVGGEPVERLRIYQGDAGPVRG